MNQEQPAEEPALISFPSCVCEVQPGLYLGDIESLEWAKMLRLTHVLSVLNLPVDLRSPGLKHWQLPVTDHESTDLLQYLKLACDWIDAALSKGGCVLVHCSAGISRSATVVAAYLMRARRRDVDTALSMLRAKRSVVCPNAGFLMQLEAWQQMGYGDEFSSEHPAYRRHVRVAAAAHSWEAGSCDQGALARIDESGGGAAYRCRKCRVLVAGQGNAMRVEAGPGQAAFAWKKRSKAGRAGGAGESAGDSSVFVEPMRWMDGVMGAVQGKLYCHKCRSRLGSFNWAGSQSSSGRWVVPAFQLHTSRLDVEQPISLESLAIRHPRVGPAAQLPPQSGLPPGRLPALPPSDEAAPSSGATTQEAAAWHEAGDGDGGSAVSGAAAARNAGEAGTNGGARLARLFDAIIFDCDGVLVDSERASCEALRQAILEVTGLDIPHAFPDDFVNVFGMDVRSCCEHYKAKCKRADWGDVAALAERVAAAKEVIYQRLTAAGVAAFPGVPRLVEAARRAGLALGVASSGSPEKIWHNLRSAALDGLFEPRHVVSAKEVACGKPAPDVYVEAMRRLGCRDPARVLVVEDAVHGLAAARAAGAFCVAVTTSLPAERLAGVADVVVGSVEDVEGMLFGVGAGSQ